MTKVIYSEALGMNVTLEDTAFGLMAKTEDGVNYSPREISLLKGKKVTKQLNEIKKQFGAEIIEVDDRDAKYFCVAKDIYASGEVTAAELKTIAERNGVNANLAYIVEKLTFEYTLYTPQRGVYALIKDPKENK